MNKNRFKFRVWLKDPGYWIEPQSNDLTEQTIPWVCISTKGEVLHIDYKFWPFEANNQDDYIIQQFTGLQDSTGKDIYEGDILKCSVSIGPDCRNPDKGIPEYLYYSRNREAEVFWGNYCDGEYVDKVECFMFNGYSLSQSINDTKGNYHDYILTYTIIGNICENPKLLKK